MLTQWNLFVNNGVNIYYTLFCTSQKTEVLNLCKERYTREVFENNVKSLNVSVGMEETPILLTRNEKKTEWKWGMRNSFEKN